MVSMKTTMTTMKTSIRIGLTALLAFWAAVAWTTEPTKLPKLVDLGADKCIPCKMMAPVLKELKTEYAGRMEVEFIDVWKNPDAGETYRIKLIPTQIFFDAAGKELFRHEGFFAKKDILAKWKELGVEFKPEGTERGEDVRGTMEGLFSALSHAVEGAPLAALAAAALWGVLSVVLSPCHLSSIPLIVGFISGQGRVSTGRAFGIASLFAVGILATIAAIGAVTAAAGRMMGDVGRWGNYFVALIFFRGGAALAGGDPDAVVGAGPGGDEAEGFGGGVVAGADFRHCARALHVRLHGAGARGGF